jgi:hypothetical protein
VIPRVPADRVPVDVEVLRDTELDPAADERLVDRVAVGARADGAGTSHLDHTRDEPDRRDMCALAPVALAAPTALRVSDANQPTTIANKGPHFPAVEPAN